MAMTAQCPHGHPIEAALDSKLGDAALDHFEKHGGRPLVVGEKDCPTCAAERARVAAARVNRGHRPAQPAIDRRDPSFVELWLAGKIDVHTQ